MSYPNLGGTEDSKVQEENRVSEEILFKSRSSSYMQIWPLPHKNKEIFSFAPNCLTIRPNKKLRKLIGPNSSSLTVYAASRSHFTDIGGHRRMFFNCLVPHVCTTANLTSSRRAVSIVPFVLFTLAFPLFAFNEALPFLYVVVEQYIFLSDPSAFFLFSFKAFRAALDVNATPKFVAKNPCEVITISLPRMWLCANISFFSNIWASSNGDIMSRGDSAFRVSGAVSRI